MTFEFWGTKPNLLETLHTCVSTGIDPLLKEKSRTQAIVLSPTPLNFLNQLLILSVLHLFKKDKFKLRFSSYIWLRIFFILKALVSANPPDLMVSAIFFTFAFLTSSQLLNLDLKLANALWLLLSEVF